MEKPIQLLVHTVDEYITKYKESCNYDEEELEILMNDELLDFEKELKLIVEQRLQRLVTSKEQNGHKLQHPYSKLLSQQNMKNIIPNEKVNRYLDDLKRYNTNDLLTPVKQMTCRSSRIRVNNTAPKNNSPQEEEIHITSSLLQPSTPLGRLLSPVELLRNIDIGSLEDTSPSIDNESSIDESDFDDDIYTYYYESDISLDSNTESNGKPQRKLNIMNF
ncbi:hypothetical protein, no similarity [Maudiozyma saulgeensis]|uniref:Uncharacterized protein n=1 Tax=Maudiozyma saulgeensis TaxID=1789683 RepID=A0A1X7R9K3_9SACH|nr:hypothetical protein, no similarity [Kazachstania saulgeensis]